MTVVFFIAPFFTDRFNLGSLVIENRALAIVVSWTFGCLCLLVLIFGAKFLTFLSVSTTRLALESDARATLIDAFSGERRRIEQELHDGPQQYLTALKLNLAAAKRRHRGSRRRRPQRQPCSLPCATRSVASHRRSSSIMA